MSSDHKHYILGSTKRDKLVLYALLAICTVSVLAEFFIHRHVDHPFEILPAFYPIFAFGSIVVLIVLSKVLRKLVMRGEDYYDH